MIRRHLELMRRLFDAAARQGLPIWLGGGWAIDARRGCVSREHDDIDLTFPAEREAAFLALLSGLGARDRQDTDYGFLFDVDGILLDCEPARWNGRAYVIDGAPGDACPDAPEGELAGMRLRCNSWAAIAWDYFHYAAKVPAAEWPAKHRASWALVRAALGHRELERLRMIFDADIRRDAHGAPMPRHEKINYVEFASLDLAASKRFFASAFGWSFEDYGPDYAAFSDEGLDGGFFRAEAAGRTERGSTLVVLYSDALEATLAKVEAAGGEVVKPIFDFPGGRRFHFVEPGGNELAVWGEAAA